MPTLEKTKKHLNYLFINTAPGADPATWARVGKSTEWTDTMNATVNTFDYIEDASPTDELDSYKPSASMPLTAYIGDPCYDFIFKLYQEQKTGTDAVTDALRVYQQKSGAANVATKTAVLLTVDNYNIATGVITFNVGQRGTPIQGTATVADGVPAFTPTVNPPAGG